MEWYEKGIITDKDLDGITLRWGDYHSMIKLIHKIVKREGIGDLLAEGPLSAAKKFGSGAEYFVIQVKGLDSTSLDWRGNKGGALQHTMSNRGACHMRGVPSVTTSAANLLNINQDEVVDMFGTMEALNPRSYEGKPQLVNWYEDIYTIIDAFGLCKFGYRWPIVPLKFNDFAQLFSFVTGVVMNGEEIRDAASRIWTLERCYILREGISKKDDYPPERWMKEPGDGPIQGEKIELEQYEGMLSEYYKLRGWDENGRPSNETLKKLDLTSTMDS